MMNINLCVFLIMCAGSSMVLSDDIPYCFKYTWVAADYNTISDKYNCSSHRNVPCIEPIIISEKPPDQFNIWENREQNKSALCPITSGNVCVKYVLSYNDAVVTSSLFCGRVTEDQKIPITSGCYQQRVDGYLVEMCACRSRKGLEPCNESVQLKYSITLIITVLICLLVKFA